MWLKDFKLYDYMPYRTGKSKTDKCTDILWPVFCYNINVCSTQDASCNVFETIVARMLKLKNNDIDAAADSLCLERDLVEFIAEKVQCVSDIEIGKSSKNLVYKIFVDRSVPEGDVLPFVVSDKDDYGQKTVLEEHNNIIVYAFDNEKSKKIYAKYINGIESENATITSKDVIRAIESYLKNISCADYDASTVQTDVASLRECLSNPITILSSPQKAFIHLTAQIEENNNDIIVSNVEGDKVDLTLSRRINILDSVDSNWIFKFKNDSVATTSLDEDMNEFSKTLDLSSAENFYNKAKAIQNKDLSNQTSKQLLLGKKDSYHAVIINLYRSIEEALYSLHQIYGVNAHLKLPYNTGAVKSFARRVKIDDKYLSFFKISEYRLRNLKSEKDMQTLLYLNILESSTADEHPIISLFRKNKEIDFMSFIFKLKQYRDMSSHDSDLQYSEDLLNKFIEKVGIIHKILDPNFRINSIKQNSSNVIDEQWRLKARICIDSQLSQLFVQNLTIESFDWLIDITQKYLKAKQYRKNVLYKGLQTEFFCCVYKFLEHLFKRAVIPKKTSINDVADFIKLHFVKKTDDNSLEDKEEENILIFNVMPDSALATVRKEGVVKVLSGMGFSLNAIVVAFLMSSDKDSLINFIKHCKKHKVNFINVIEKLIKYRGHGSNFDLDISCSEFDEIFKQFLFIFKSYEEFFK